MPRAQAAVEKIRATGFEPEGYTLSTYAAIQAWAQAANEAGTTDSAKVAELLRAHDWDTVIGTIGFDEQGDLKTADYVWYVLQDGGYSEDRKSTRLNSSH